MTTNTNKKDCVYFFRMEGCGHCENMKPVWEEVVSKLKNTNPPIDFRVIESSEIQNMDKEEKEDLKADDIMGYPELRILTKNGKTSTFKSNRTAEDLIEWIRTLIPEENTNYRSVVKRIPTPHPAKNTKRNYLRGGKKSRKRRRRRTPMKKSKRNRRH